MRPRTSMEQNKTVRHGSGGGGSGGGGHHRRHGGWWPGYWWSWNWWPSGYYPYQSLYQQFTTCCYDEQAGALYCPGTRLDQQPAAALATREQYGRMISLVSSPALGQPRWLWHCPP